MDRMMKLSDAIRKLIEGEFSGYIKINFSQGSLGRIEKSEEIEDAAIVRVPKTASAGSKGENLGQDALLTVPLLLMLSFALAGCVSSGMVKPAQSNGPSGPGSVRLVQPGDSADIRYLCRLRSGEIAASTDPVADNQSKSNLYVRQEKTGPVAVKAVSADGAAAADAAYFQQRSPEDEIAYQLAHTIAGMKAGDKRTTEIKAEDAPARDAPKYIARLTRVRTRPKELRMSKSDYESKMRQSPEVGQVFDLEPDFPGRVGSVSGQEVTILFSATPGAVLPTPFGPGRIREEGPDYKIEIEARKGALVRAAEMAGRISGVDDRTITVDFGNAFGGEALMCDVTLEKIADAKPVESGE